MPHNGFEPIYKAHAIIEMVVFFEFEQNLDTYIDLLLPLLSEMSEDFPNGQPIRVFDLNISSQMPEGSPPSPKIAGIELQRLNPNGSLEWLIRIVGGSVSVHCLDYSRWEYVWPKMNQYFETVFAKLASIDENLIGVGLKYVDQFVFQGDLEDYDLSNLFKKDTPLVHPRAFSSGAQWHCNCGWFQDIEELGKILSQLNTVGITQGEQSSVLIDNTLTYRPQASQAPFASCLSPSQIGGGLRTKIVEKMHTANKHLLSDLLLDFIQQRISLYVEDSV
jgi:uncharacterized protein (TIGR04255 family)